MSKRQESHVLAAGDSLILAPAGAPWTLAVAPEVGATVTLEVSLTPASRLGVGGTGGVWFALGEPLTSGTLVAFPSPVTALRLNASFAGASVELVS